MMTKNEAANNSEIRYCKKCGCELSSTNKNKLCDNCRIERAVKIRNGTLGVGTVGGIVYFFITRGKHGDRGTKA